VRHICEASAVDTARLRLRPMTIDDAPGVHALWTEPAMLRRVWEADEVDFAQTLAVVERSIEFFDSRRAGLWCAFLREEDLLIGFGGFWFVDEIVEPALVYGISSLHGHRGLAPEMLRALLRHAFADLGFARVVTNPDARTLPTVQKLGFVPDRTAVVAGAPVELHGLDVSLLRDEGAPYRLVTAPQPVVTED